MSFDELSFDSYCIVCDRLIVQAPEPVAVPVEKKKKATGTIRVKNPDGSTTTRTANGVKTTRPAIRRNPASAARLAALANQNAKLQPLTRTMTNESSDGSGSGSGNGTGSTKVISSKSSPTPTPPATTTSPLSSPSTEEPPFKSEIYCSRDCASTDAGRSSETYRDIARTLSLDTVGLGMPMGPPSPLFVSGSDTDSSASLRAGVGSSSSGTTSNGVSDAGPAPATSAPKTMEYFRIGRDAPDNAWREYEREKERQRRSSMAGRPATIAPLTTAGLAVFSTGAPHSAGVPGVPPMTRQRSTQSSTTFSLSGASSDSLASLWHEHGEPTQTHTQQPALPPVHRTNSGGGAMRAMTPLHANTPLYPTRDALGAGHRSTSCSSDGSSTGGSNNAVTSGNTSHRPIPRSSLSHTNLGGGSPQPPSAFPPEFGSVPSHTAALFQSYATAFHPREPSGLSLSTSYRGSPYLSGSMTPASSSSRRGSVNNGASAFGSSVTGASGFSASLSNAAGIQRPLSGTIRARPRDRDSVTAPTWDAFAREEVIARSEKTRAYVSRARENMDAYAAERDCEASGSGTGNAATARYAEPVAVPAAVGAGRMLGYDSTPKQSLEVENGRWKIKYTHQVDEDRQGRRSGSGNGYRSRSRVSTTSSNDSDHITSAASASAMMPPPPPPHAVAIPMNFNPSSPPHLSTSNSTMGRTPRTAHAHGQGQGRRSSPQMTMPDMTSLRLSSSVGAQAYANGYQGSNATTPSLGVTPVSGHPFPHTTVNMTATSPAPGGLGRSVPRPGVDWHGAGAKTYELPKGVVANPTKGLFYFGS